MSFVLGNIGEERNEKEEKESEVTLKEITVYSGGKCVLACYGEIYIYPHERFVRIRAQDGYRYTVLDGTVIVKEKSRKD